MSYLITGQQCLDTETCILVTGQQGVKVVPFFNLQIYTMIYSFAPFPIQSIIMIFSI